MNANPMDYFGLGLNQEVPQSMPVIEQPVQPEPPVQPTPTPTQKQAAQINTEVKNTPATQVPVPKQDAPAAPIQNPSVDDTTRNALYNQALTSIQPDERGIRTLPASMGFSKDTYEITGKKYSESNALMGSAIAGALGYFAVRAMGGDANQATQAMTMAFSDVYIEENNRGERYDTIDALKAEGYTNASIDMYIKSGDKADLKKREVTPWQAQKDGTFMRTLTDGSLEIWGTPTPQSIEIDEGDSRYRVPVDNMGNPVTPRDKWLKVGPSAQALQRPTTAPRNPVSTNYETVDGNNYRVTTYSDGSSYREQVQEKPKSATELKMEAAKEGLTSAATQSYAKSQDTIDLIDRIEKSDIGAVTGWLSGRTPTMTEKSMAVEQQFNQLFNQQFLDNVKQMRGMGALSNQEGAKISAASSALLDPATGGLKTTLSESFVKQELSRIKEAAKNMQRISQFVQANGREPTIEEFNQMRGIKEEKTPRPSFDETGTAPITTPSGRTFGRVVGPAQ